MVTTATATVPLTRASRRMRTAPSPVITDASAVEPAASEAPERPGIPAAAIAWAAAAAAAVDPHAVVPVEPVLAPAEPFVLIEPTAVEPEREAPSVESVDEPEPEPAREAPNAESVDEADASASDVDEFERAARLFSFTGETPVQSAKATEPDASDAEATAEAEGAASVDEESTASATQTATRRRVRAMGRQLSTASFSVGVMGIVGLLTVGMTTSADAVAPLDGTEPTSLLASDALGADVAEEDIQAYVAPDDIESLALDRDEGYAMVSIGELASEAGISHYSDLFVNDPNAAIQWPFSVGVPISSGFGPRWGRMHEGVDFVPGEGAEVQAIADGTVREATNSGGAYGVVVVIDHVIDGQLVSSRYGHMLVGSLRVSPGDVVKVGTVLGNTGNTGRSTGVHTHFEVLLGGTTAVDPITWLRQNAGRDSLG